MPTLVYFSIHCTFSCNNWRGNSKNKTSIRYVLSKSAARLYSQKSLFVWIQHKHYCICVVKMFCVSQFVFREYFYVVFVFHTAAICHLKLNSISWHRTWILNTTAALPLVDTVMMCIKACLPYLVTAQTICSRKQNVLRSQVVKNAGQPHQKVIQIA